MITAEKLREASKAAEDAKFDTTIELTTAGFWIRVRKRLAGEWASLRLVVPFDAVEADGDLLPLEIRRANNDLAARLRGGRPG